MDHVESLRERWRQGRPMLGAWLVVPSVVTAEAAARSGADYVVLDAQHGAIELADIVGVIQAVLLGGASPLVRVPANTPAAIGRALDAGADGVIVPMVSSPAEAADAARSCRYAPVGTRSYGPTVVALRGGDQIERARDDVAVIPMIETVEAVAEVEAIVATPGVDAVYVGPSDLSLTLGLPPGNHDETPRFADALARVSSACRRAGVVAGIHATGALAPQRLAGGFRMVTVANDLTAMRQGIAHELDLAKRRA